MHARTAGEAALSHLLQFHRSIADLLSQWDVRGDNSGWRDAQQPHIREFEMSLHLIPNAELRSRLSEVVTLIYDSQVEGDQTDAAGRALEELNQVAVTVAISQEGIELVAAALRGEPLPTRSHAFLATWSEVRQRRGEDTGFDNA